MHLDDIVALTRDRLAHLGMPGVEIRIENEEPGEFFGIDDPLRLEPEDDHAVLLLRNSASYPDDALQRIIEHRGAWLAERVDQGFTPVHGTAHYLLATLQERIRDAYLEFTAGERMITALGQKRSDAYQRTSAPGLCDTVHARIRDALLPTERFELLTLLIREHAKDLLAKGRPLAPPVIGGMLPAMAPVFRQVRGLQVPRDLVGRVDAGLRRAELISLLGVHLINHVDVVQSYDTGRVTFNPGGEPSVLHRYNPPLDDETLRHAGDIEQRIVGAYARDGHAELVPNGFN